MKNETTTDNLTEEEKDQIKLALIIGVPVGLGILDDKLLSKLLFYLEVEAMNRDELLDDSEG